MKKFISFIMIVGLALPLMSQEADTIPKPPAPPAPEAISEEEAIDLAIEEAAEVEVEVEVEVEAPEAEEIETSTPDKTRVTLGKNEVVIVEENGDTVVVGLGSRGISIVEGEDGVEINVLDMAEKKCESKKKRKNRFDASWAGFELGLNNFLTPDYSMVLPPDESFMDLNTGKSWNWNINFVDFGVGLGTPYVGLTSGLGFEFINYNFDGQNGIMKDPDTGEIIEYIPSYAGNITKSKMNIAYVTAPLLLEFHIPAGGSRNIRIAGGVIGGLKMWSNTKLKYRESGNKSKEKIKGDYNLSPLRWGVTARVGYGEINLFANYYMTTLFKPGTGPELNPFTVGMAFLF